MLEYMIVVTIIRAGVPDVSILDADIYSGPNAASHCEAPAAELESAMRAEQPDDVESVEVDCGLLWDRASIDQP